MPKLNLLNKTSVGSIKYYLNTCSGAFDKRSWNEAQDFLSSSPCLPKMSLDLATIQMVPFL